MSKQVKERPILFSGPMVRAILDGRKTQTRRVVKFPIYDRGFGCEISGSELNGELVQDPGLCPYGKPGDRLWVRETFVLESTEQYHGDHEIPDDGRPTKPICDEYEDEYLLIPHYRATEPEPHIVPYEGVADEWDDRTRWKPSIFMPRWASRILLEITNVHVERLNEITKKEALKEGVDQEIVNGVVPHNPKRAFKDLWESINGKGSFDDRWVWVVEFKRLD